MKKIVIIIIAIFVIASSTFLTFNIIKSVKFQNEITEKEKKLEQLKNSLDKNKEKETTKETEYENLKKEKNEQLKELNEWQEKIDELKKVL